MVTLLLLIVGIGLGVYIANDYGMSWDEAANFKVGRDAGRAYLSPGGYQDYMDQGEPLAHHGPSYFILYSAGATLIREQFQDWHIADGRHLMNYFSFLLGVASFYFLTVRVVRRSYAWMITALFATQPLIFGHGFINQKDTPFMAFFLASVAVGLAVVDRYRKREQDDTAGGRASGHSFQDLVKKDWDRVSKSGKWAVVLILVFLLFIITDLLVLGNIFEWMNGVLRQAYARQAWAPIQGAFDLIAEDAYKSSLTSYEIKLSWAYWLFLRFQIVIGILVLAFLVIKRVFPTSSQYFWRWNRNDLLLLVIAGGLVGFTISIRPIGAFAGVLVGVYWLLHERSRAIGPLIIYGLVIGLAMYFTWPYLWDDPIGRLLESFGFTVDFYANPSFYRGETVRADNLPWHYFPTLASIQLTEPIVLFFWIGLLGGCWLLYRRNMDPVIALVLGLWLFLPLSLLISSMMGVSGNIRQLLFMVPPIVLIAGIGLVLILEKIKSRVIQLLIFTLAILPGIVGIIRLHPYEYAYFNQFVGGSRGASKSFHTDNWCTSYRAAMEYINSVAESGDVVAVYGPVYSAEPFAREDLTLISENQRWQRAEYLLTCQWWLGRDLRDEGFYYVHEIGRAGAVFADIYEKVK